MPGLTLKATQQYNTQSSRPSAAALRMPRARLGTPRSLQSLLGKHPL